MRPGGTADHRVQVKKIPFPNRDSPRDESPRCSLRLRRPGTGGSCGYDDCSSYDSCSSYDGRTNDHGRRAHHDCNTDHD